MSSIDMVPFLLKICFILTYQEGISTKNDFLSSFVRILKEEPLIQKQEI